MVLEHAIRILSEAAIVWPPRWLYVGHMPWLRAEHAEKGLGMRGSRSNLEVERLLNDAPLRRPERRQLENEILEGHERVMSFSTLIDFGSRSRCIAIRLRWSDSSSRKAVRSMARPARAFGPLLRAR